MFRKPPNSTIVSRKEEKCLIIVFVLSSMDDVSLYNIFREFSKFAKTSVFKSVLNDLSSDSGGIGRKEKYGDGFVGFLVCMRSMELEDKFVKGGEFRIDAQSLMSGSKNFCIIWECCNSL